MENHLSSTPLEISVNQGFYAKYGKRILDFTISLLFLLAFFWLFIIIGLLVLIKLGRPIIYVAERIGLDGKAFRLYKFRSMTNEKDSEGILLPGTKRLTKFGRLLRSTSLDELPEIFNILKGDMSFIGPRPMPVTYRKFFTAEEWHRHDVRPGLSGYAQVHGRNAISWDRKFELDLWYVSHLSFALDVKTVIDTIVPVLKRENIGQGEQSPGSLYAARADWQRGEDGMVVKPPNS